ncbi:putative transmembrane protein [Toxoplasma gondii MAS]|uniref:Putative transmembrane protein n=1 Tax=Toxoplasma gondii MAS TaxID=943118 RepID=A0A086PXN5_TOXGO|nr:putative transmembrane protein [Toxoplasma gondii MAS]
MMKSFFPLASSLSLAFLPFVFHFLTPPPTETSLFTSPAACMRCSGSLRGKHGAPDLASPLFFLFGFLLALLLLQVPFDDFSPESA